MTPAVLAGDSVLLVLVGAGEDDAAAVALDPVFDCGNNCRPAVEHNGYTSNHLPVGNGLRFRLREEDANFAIFAARMAFSNFPIRSLLR